MTEEHNQDRDSKEQVKPENSPKLWLLPASVLLGALIISGSVLYGFRMLALNLGNLSFSGAGQATAVQSSGSPAAPAPTAAAAAPAPVTLTDRSNEPVLGNKNASVTMVEFGDFQCPYCKAFFQQTFSQIKSQYVNTGKVKYIFRDFPLTQIHQNAQIAAEAAECANQQGQFWAYHDLLYTNGQSDGTNLDSASLKKYADQLGLNKGTFGFGTNKFNNCLDSNATLATVNADEALGTSLGVSGTPTFVIIKGNNNTIDTSLIRQGAQNNQFVINLPNGDDFIVGAQPFSIFQQALDAALK